MDTVFTVKWVRSFSSGVPVNTVYTVLTVFTVNTVYTVILLFDLIVERQWIIVTKTNVKWWKKRIFVRLNMKFMCAMQGGGGISEEIYTDTNL